MKKIFLLIVIIILCSFVLEAADPTTFANHWLKSTANKDWHTSEKLKADKKGHITFRGFHGDYSVTVWHKGKLVKGSFCLNRNNPSPVKVLMSL